MLKVRRLTNKQKSRMFWALLETKGNCGQAVRLLENQGRPLFVSVPTMWQFAKRYGIQTPKRGRPRIRVELVG